MTTKQTAPPFRLPEKYAPEDRFPERPKRTDMQNALYRERPGHGTALARHYGSPETTLVLGDIPVRHTFRRGLGPQMLRYPDLIVAFGVDSAEVIARHGYAIDDQGKPPDFVLEIASPSTALNDYTASGWTTPPTASRNTGGSTPPTATATPSGWPATGWLTANTSP